MTIGSLGGPAFVTGIPDSPTCGANPCGFFDVVGTSRPSPECLSFVQCADPSDFSSWLAGEGSLFPSLAAQAGSDANSTVGAFVDSALGLNGPEGGSGINWATIALVAAIGLLGFELLTARR